VADVKPKPSKAAKAKPAEPAEPGPQTPPDEAPKPRQRKRGPASKAERRAADLRAIQTGFTELLIDTPAMIGAMTQDPWLVGHTTTQGPAVVERLVAEAERSERFREVCLRAVRGQSMMMLVVALGAYLGPIGLHYGVIPGAEQFGIPARRLRVPGAPQRPQEAPGAPPPSPPPPRRQNGTEPASEAANAPPPAEAI
jgi:hypothetical protein